jgi:hypothetical protein
MSGFPHASAMPIPISSSFTFPSYLTCPSFVLLTDQRRIEQFNQAADDSYSRAISVLLLSDVILSDVIFDLSLVSCSVRLTKPRRKQATKKDDCQTGYRVEGAPRAPLVSRTAAFVRGRRRSV